jgi:thiol:disulfide interchange protein DsbC
MKKLTLTILCFLCIIPAYVSAEDTSPEEAFKKIFPNSTFESISPSSIKGIYEVYTGNQIYYFIPEAEVIIRGDIISKDGKNLTRQSILKKMAPKMAALPLEHALKIGNGKTSVIEFTDPNCPYCRQAFNFLSQRKDVTTYIFLIPLSQDSEKKIRHILCSKDRLKTYEEVMTGKLDNKPQLDICNDKKAEEIMITHRRLASEIGVRATPSFFIKGQVINGFEKTFIENLLNE